MENVLKFIKEWGYVILFALYVVGTCIKMGKQWTVNKAYALMLAAKQQAKEEVLKSGQEQEDLVVEGLYLLLNKLKIPFVTKDNLRSIVKQLYRKSMDLIDDGKLNNSIE